MNTPANPYQSSAQTKNPIDEMPTVVNHPRSPVVSLASIVIFCLAVLCIVWAYNLPSPEPGLGHSMPSLGFVVLVFLLCPGLMLVSTVLAAVALLRGHRFRWLTLSLHAPVICIFFYLWAMM